MRCIYCEKNVVGLGDNEIVMIQGEGPAHRSCHERHAMNERRFGSLNLQILDDEMLNELKELVLTEWNARQKDDMDDIELFA